MQAAHSNDFLRKNQPEIIYHGFVAEGYALAEHKTALADQAIATLEDAHQMVTGTRLSTCALEAAKGRPPCLKLAANSRLIFDAACR